MGGKGSRKLFSTILLQIACEKHLVERYEFASEACGERESAMVRETRKESQFTFVDQVEEELVVAVDLLLQVEELSSWVERRQRQVSKLQLVEPPYPC